jgi:hypothetical protein
MGPNAGPILGGSHLCQDPIQYPYLQPLFSTLNVGQNEEKSVDYQPVVGVHQEGARVLLFSRLILVANRMGLRGNECVDLRDA